MAEKRMFTKRISDSDAFIEMPATSQALYFHLNQGADDDGFNNQVQMAMWKSHASIDDLKILMAKNFIIRFESGVIVIKHWRMHNTLRRDRYVPTNFQEELAMLGVKENEAYTLNGSQLVTERLPIGCQTVAEMLPDGCQMVAKRLPQDSIDKISIGKSSIDDVKRGKKTKVFVPPTIEEVIEYAKNKGHEELAQRFFDYFNDGDWIDSQGNKVRNWKQKFLTWCTREEKKPASEKKTQVRYGTFDPEDAFQKALQRSYQEEQEIEQYVI